MKRYAWLLLVAFLASAGVTSAQDKKEPQKLDADTQKAEAQVKEFLTKIKGESGQVLYLGSPELDKAFPMHKFFAVRYRIYPVAKVLPEGMKPSNVFVVPKNGRAGHIKDAKALESFFKANLGEVKETIP